MPEKTCIERIAQALKDALDADEAAAKLVVQTMQLGYTLGLADAKKAS